MLLYQFFALLFNLIFSYFYSTTIQNSFIITSLISLIYLSTFIIDPFLMIKIQYDHIILLSYIILCLDILFEYFCKEYKMLEPISKLIKYINLWIRSNIFSMLVSHIIIKLMSFTILILLVLFFIFKSIMYAKKLI